MISCLLTFCGLVMPASFTASEVTTLWRDRNVCIIIITTIIISCVIAFNDDAWTCCDDAGWWCRVASNGDTANKIGTYQIAIVAKHHGVPFYIAAPSSSVDLSISSGQDIIIEERPTTEMTCIAGVPLTASGSFVHSCLIAGLLPTQLPAHWQLCLPYV